MEVKMSSVLCIPLMLSDINQGKVGTAKVEKKKTLGWEMGGESNSLCSSFSSCPLLVRMLQSPDVQAASLLFVFGLWLEEIYHRSLQKIKSPTRSQNIPRKSHKSSPKRFVK